MKSEPYTVDPEAEREYLLERLEWRASLSDFEVRALAYEYKVRPLGHEDDCLSDAWAEYEKRFRGVGPRQEFLSRDSRPRPRRSRKGRNRGH